MKRIITCFLLVWAWTAQGQNFEGTIHWSMKMEITDPATKAKMDEAAKKMSDPATQAKIKEMQAKMNDPQMKAMMDANPQMKQQMENAMKMMQGGDMSSMMPKGMVIKIKDNNVLSKVDGGMMAMETLYLKDKNASYFLDRQNKTYSPMNNNSGNREDSGMQPKVTKTSETMSILGYNCTKYIVEMTRGTHTMTENIWTTTDIKGIDLTNLKKQRMGRGESILFEGMDGVPMKVEAVTPEGKMTMEVTEIKKESLSSSDFSIPSDYKETQGMFGMGGH